MNTAATDVSLVWPAFIAGLLVTATHVPLGIQVLKRGIVFIDLAIAQIAGVGGIFADWLGWEPHGWAVQVAALCAALAGALLLNITDKLWPEVQEATIGVTFVVAANVASWRQPEKVPYTWRYGIHNFRHRPWPARRRFDDLGMFDPSRGGSQRPGSTAVEA